MSGKMLKLGTARAAAGTKAWGTLTVREGAQRVRLGVAVIHGAREGEHVVALANQHGAEVNGVEALRRVVEEIDPRRLSGSVFVIPSANPRAALLGNEFYPEDVDEETRKKYQGGRYREPGYDRHTCPFNMNRLWPGCRGRHLVDRMVYEIWNRAVMASHRKASLLLDYHCASTPSTVFAAFREDVDVGIASGAPSVIHTRSAATGNGRRYCRIACRDAGIQGLTVELGGQRQMIERSIEDGRRIMFNLLKFWGMLAGAPEFYDAPTVVLDPWQSDWGTRKPARRSYEPAFAGREGLVVTRRGRFDRVRKGERVCHVIDPFKSRIVEEHRAARAGALLAVHDANAVCRKGDHLFTVSQARWVRPSDYVRKLDPDRYRGPDARWHA